MAAPPVIVPPDVVVTGPQLQSNIVQMLQKMETDAKATLSKPEVDEAIVTGLFGYLALAFPAAAPELTGLGNFVAKAIGAM